MKKSKYGLFTTIGMIVGIVIGSGIFFKSDNILVATNGSITLGVLVFCLAAISIIFGSLSIAELASRNDKAGGIITYAEDACNKPTACAFGWFHTFLYYPTLTAVVAWVAGIYICILFGIEGTLMLQVFIGFIVILVLFITNILSTKLGGYLQNASTLIKLIPLILIAFTGLFFGNPSAISFKDVTQMSSLGWMSAITPIAFSFDGWIVATSLSHEIKNPKKNLPLALIVAPLFILTCYILYFVGISIYIGPETVMRLGDAHVDLAANKFLGPWGAKVILVFVIISVLGTVNGLVMGIIRLPYALAIRGMFPNSKRFSHINEKFGISLSSAFVGLAITSLWMLLHYITQHYKLLPNSDISEIPITFNYLTYILLYIKVLKLAKEGEIKGVWRGYMNPLLAILGSLMILWGSLSVQLFWIYAAFCSLLMLSAVLFWNITQKNITHQ